MEVRRRSDGAVRIVKIQDEVVLYPSGNGKKRFYLMKDETELIEQGYRPDAFLGRYRRIDGTCHSSMIYSVLRENVLPVVEPQ